MRSRLPAETWISWLSSPLSRFFDWNPRAYVSVNVASLDDLPAGELLEAPVTFYDGRADNWWQRPAEVRHL